MLLIETMNSVKRSALGIAVTLSGFVLSSGVALAGPINLGSAGNYAVVGVGGDSDTKRSNFEIYQSDTVVNGNVAEGPNTTLTHGIDATVNGRWDYDTTDANPAGSGYTGHVTGGFNQVNLSGVSSDAMAASTAAAAKAPTQTFSTLSENQVIVGNGGLNVIRITGDVMLKQGLTLSGTVSDQFIFQLTSSTAVGHDVLALSGMTMNLLGGISPDNIVWNLNGTGGGIDITSMAAGQQVYGTFLAPDRDIVLDHGIVDGRVIGGGNPYSKIGLSIHSGSEITVTNRVPDGGATVALLGIGLLGLGGLRKKLAA
jgi:choice-of-anchor A domain-containing protein